MTIDTAGHDLATEAVAADRAEIDALDAEILRLVQSRRQVSRRIQAARLAQGGGRVVHSREVAVVDRYAGALGAPGVTLATALLALCRGTRD